MFSYIIRFTWEIWIKWTRTRWNYIRKLSSNIEKALGNDIITIEYNYDKIIVHTECVVDIKLSNVFWVSKFSRFTKINFTNLQDLLNKAFEFYKDKLNWKSFVVRAKRQWIHLFKSLEIERELWSMLWKLWNPVNLKNPDFTVSIEVVWNEAYLLECTIKWPWWFPVWSVWRIPVLFSWWIDSSVAVWYLYRMWLDVDFLYYDLWWDKTLSSWLQSSKYLIENWWYWSKGSFYKFDLKPLLIELKKTRPSYQMLLLKYFFYKIAEEYCKLTWLKSFWTWEAINQVSTQVFSNLQLLNSVTDRFVVRPLICMPKKNIIDMATYIWSFKYSYTWEEFCNISKWKTEVDWSFKHLINQVYRIDKTILHDIIKNIDKLSFDTTILSNNYTSWDIIYVRRDKNDISEYWINILFDIFEEELKDLDKNKKYFVTCKNWKLSKIVASWLKNNWFNVIS